MSLQDLQQDKSGNVNFSFWVWCYWPGWSGIRCLHCFHIMYRQSQRLLWRAKQTLPCGRTAPVAARVPVAAAAAPTSGYKLRFQLPLPLSLRPHCLLHLTRWQTSKKLFSAHGRGEECQSTSTRSRCDLAIEVKRQDTTRDNVSPFAVFLNA